VSYTLGLMQGFACPALSGDDPRRISAVWGPSDELPSWSLQDREGSRDSLQDESPSSRRAIRNRPCFTVRASLPAEHGPRLRHIDNGPACALVLHSGPPRKERCIGGCDNSSCWRGRT
jgi:hypothetical protein